MPPNSSRRAYSRSMYAPEVYLFKNYLDMIGHDCKFTVEDYWEAVKKYVICLDMKTLDLVWPKYESRYREHTMYGEYFHDDNHEKLKTANFDFINWFNLYKGSLKYKQEYEKYADVVFK